MTRHIHFAIHVCALVCLLVVSLFYAAATSAAPANPLVRSADPFRLIDQRPTRADTTSQDEADVESDGGAVGGGDGDGVFADGDYIDNGDAAKGLAAPVKLVLYGLRMIPTGRDAKEYSRAGWGGGLRVTASIGPLAHIGAFGLGFEVTNLLSRTKKFWDPRTLLRVEQQTFQNLYRISIGPELGAHGHGFFRPYAGANLAVSIHDIRTAVVIPNDADPDNEIRQSLDSDGASSLGYDLVLGADLNFRGFLVDGGVRFLKSFGVPQQLGLEAERIHPGYFQVYLGVGIDFNVGGARWLDMQSRTSQIDRPRSARRPERAAKEGG